MRVHEMLLKNLKSQISNFKSTAQNLKLQNGVWVCLLILIAVFQRWFNFKTGYKFFGPNVEFVTVATLLMGVYLGGVWRIMFPIVSLFISDALIGSYSPIFYFTWSAYLLMAFASPILQKFQKTPTRLILSSTFYSLLFTLFFYFWTNFGVWRLGWYPQTWTGLLESYIAALPFLRFHLIGNLLFVPLGFTLVEFLRNFKAQPFFRSNLIKG